MTVGSVAFGVLVVAASVASDAYQPRSHVARNGRTYRSVLGDPGMRWKKPTRAAGRRDTRGAEQPTAEKLVDGDASSRRALAAQPAVGVQTTQAPRMQLFFYSLCSKAMPANFSVVPAPSDTCSAPVDGILGQGMVERVESGDCCAACLMRPWCLAWTETKPGTCALKDNALPEVSPSPPSPSDFRPHNGTCGGTAFVDASACNGTGVSGAVRAHEHRMRSLDDCARFCASNVAGPTGLHGRARRWPPLSPAEGRNAREFDRLALPCGRVQVRRDHGLYRYLGEFDL